MKAERIEDRIIEALKEFTEKLEAGKPIEATQVRREMTPDGPIHTQRKVILNHD